METNRRKIFIVDDNVGNLTMTKSLLKSRYEVYPVPSAEKIFELLENVLPDLILLDIRMPDMDGYEIIRKLKSDRRFSGVPVIFVTAKSDEESEIKGFELGAVDYITKPFSAPRLIKRIENQLLLAQHMAAAQRRAGSLSTLVGEKAGEVLNLQNAIINTIADLVEFRNKPAGEHIMRAQLYVKALIEGLFKKKIYADEISKWNMDMILPSIQLHDIGKIAVPDAILNKTGELSPGEFEIMKTHVKTGLDVVNKIITSTAENDFLSHALNVIGAHHEKWDGSGFPKGLKGNEIPLEGRLMALADVYDELVRKECTCEEVRAFISERSGKHFDPALVEVFIGAEDEFIEITRKYRPYDSDTRSYHVEGRD